MSTRFDFSTAKVRSSFSATADYETINNDVIMKGIKEQKVLELELLSRHQSCPPEVDQSIVARNLGSMDMEKLQKDSTIRIYNTDIMQAIACVADSIFTNYGDGSLTGNERIKEFIKNARTFGQPSAVGAVMKADLGKGKDLFVIKSPRSPDNFDELIHETIVAFYGTNKLRNDGIPNYAYIYGSISCSPPFIDDNNKKVTTFCNSTSGKSVAYAIYENISPAVGMHDFVETCTAEDYMLYLIATLVAIRAGKDIGFTHYDLHADNVLAREVSKTPFYYLLPTPEGQMYCYSKGIIPTIIDYGMSHIEPTIDGKKVHLGHNGDSAPFVSIGIFRDKCFQVYDAYKFLCFTLSAMFYSNNNVFDQVRELLFFYTTENPVYVIQNQRSTYFAPPYSEANANSDIWDFITYCRNFCKKNKWIDPLSTTKNLTSNELSCQGDCLNIKEELNSVNALSIIPMNINTITSFYDSYGIMYAKYKSASKDGKTSKDIVQTLATDLISLSQNFGSKLDDILKDERKNFVEYTKHIVNFQLNTFPDVYLDSLNKQILDGIKSTVINISNFSNAYNKIRMNKNILKFISNVFKINDKPNHECNKLYADIVAYLDRFKSFAKDINDYIYLTVSKIAVPKKFNIDDKGAKVFNQKYDDYYDFEDQFSRKKFQEFKWYIIVLPTISALIMKIE